MTEMGPWRGAGLLLPMVLALGAQAAEPAVDCANAMAQNDMNICADRDFQASDRQLNAAYRKIVAGLEAHEKELLVAAQRAWVAFRDKECAYESVENEGGSIYPMEYSGCLTRLTKERTRELSEPQ